MALTNLHTDYLNEPFSFSAKLSDEFGNRSGTYHDTLLNYLKARENDALKHGATMGIHDDGAGLPTIGYGLNLANPALTEAEIRLLLAEAFGGTLTAAQERGVNRIGDYLDGVITAAELIAEDATNADVQSLRMTDVEATRLLEAMLDGLAGVNIGFGDGNGYEDGLTSLLVDKI